MKKRKYAQVFVQCKERVQFNIELSKNLGSHSKRERKLKKKKH